MTDLDIDSLRRAATALAPHVVRTPLLNSPRLDDALGCRLFVKAENLQATGSFKLRGALHTVLSIDDAERRRGVITYSAGNHGQPVAAAARMVGCPATIVLPTTAPKPKVDGCRWWGAEVVLYDPATQDRRAVTQALVDAGGQVLVPPFDDDRVIAGQGTVGLEIVDQLREGGVRPDAAVVNCSGGGLAAGTAMALRDAWLDLEFHVAEIAGFEKMARSLRSGRPEENKPVASTVMDGINGPSVGGKTLRVLLAQPSVGALSVDDDEALAAMRVLWEHLKIVVEPAAAAATAAVRQQAQRFRGRTVVVVASGGNVDAAVFARALG